MRKFLGTYMHKMDTKGRVSLPSKYRSILADQDLVIVPGDHNSLWVYTEEEYDKFTEDLSPSLLEDDELSQLRYSFLAGAEYADLDASGRIRVSARFREHAGLGKDVTIVGSRDLFELWDSEAYEKFVANINRNEARKAMKSQKDQSR